VNLEILAAELLAQPLDQFTVQRAGNHGWAWWNAGVSDLSTGWVEMEAEGIRIQEALCDGFCQPATVSSSISVPTPSS
jgi:hypothetical protein